MAWSLSKVIELVRPRPKRPLVQPRLPSSSVSVGHPGHKKPRVR